MNKLLLSFAITSFSFASAFSQIILEEEDFPQAGDFIYQGVDTLVPLNITPGAGGANQTWDFSELRTRLGDTLFFENPVNVSGGSDFPNAFLAVEQFGGWGFVENNNSKVEIVGFAGDFSGFGLDMTIHFQDPQTILPFPATYESAFQDTSIIDAKILAPPGLIPIPGVDSIRFKRYTTISSEIDGYGNVVTPLQTYAALRQKNIEHNTDSVWVRISILGWILAPGQGGFQNPSNSINHRYNYLIKEVGYYAVSLTANENDSIIRATFMSDPSLCCFGASVEENSFTSDFSIFPNPASTEIFIRAEKTSSFFYSVNDITGKEIFGGRANESSVRLDVSPLAGGLYICRVFSADGKIRGSQKISITGK